MVTQNNSAAQILDANSKVLKDASALTMRQELVGGFIKYIGLAAPGTATSAASWQIREFTNDAQGVVTAVKFADGNNQFDNIWDNITSLSYS